ncbi:hypothetical protein RE628_13955 [Paenibacillus sp. D2_2]|uniref:hypothetical protein n=1 Tax=Paenibacillus sp. D2_2 TaxID=3073092 RepID=UPI002815CEE1|nr:hypothetical protein [Paenibacillus sp. D2_2]WMT43249.1 hypothetical protein RE628_13955 [Paenibacillus sp. D2_2]
MNLNFTLLERDFHVASQAVGETIRYCVPADLTLGGKRAENYFVIGEQKWALIQKGAVIESGFIADAGSYKVVPLIGSAVLEGKKPEASLF